MTKKSDLTAALLDKIEPRYPPAEVVEGFSLLEQGLYATLRRRLSAGDSKAGVLALRKAYGDWNELRVAQAQEINGVLGLGPKGVAVAGDVREYLQEVFQRSHGMELEFLRDDPQSAQRFVSILPFIGMAAAHHLMWIASGSKDLPVTPALVRVLDRLGLVSRTASVKKARGSVEPLVPEGREVDFVYRLGEVATRWCDARKPVCQECPLVGDCRFGKKAFREWKQQQHRLEVQRAREAARLAILQRKEEARRRREEARERKKAALEAAKRAKEAERRSKIEARKKAREDARLARLRSIEEAKKRREAEAARKRAEAEAKKTAARAAAEAKKAAAKKAALKAAAAKKAAKAKKPAKRPSRAKKG